MLLITKEFLLEEYVDKKKSTITIAQELGASRSTVNRHLKLHKIPVRTQGEHKIKDLTGMQFGQWTVMGKKGIYKNRESLWFVKCSCGVESIAYRSHLMHNRTNRCKQCGYESRRDKRDIPNIIWRQLQKSANSRNLTIRVSRKYLFEVYISQNKKCALSGLDIVFAKRQQDHNRGGTTASIDRIDSNKGYIKGNIQWVHKDINKMKNNHNEIYFKQLCKMVAEHECKN